ncbi:uncharacterized protein LOC106669338 [Cimex lectularius]|uniref:Osiris 16 n=1 Tax=Cimex lectularius TaxID=79782 RepID=A0A8I6S0N7_CIMLE|nr:uncharacterized protein LOC106669338 [Cimex lectularius]
MIIAKKMILKSINVLCLVVSFATAASFQDPDVDVDSYNSVNLTTDDALKEIMGKECRGGYSPFCLKLGLMRLMGRGGGFTIPIVPGVRLTSPELPQGPLTSPSKLAKEPELLDSLLLKRLTDYLGSLSISVNILDKSMPLYFAKAYFGNNPITGRKRDKNGGALAAAGLMSVGTMLAVGMAALAAMAGKALMASLLALMLAAVASLSKGGGEEGKTTYEIVAKPIVSHQHSHSSEVIHGGHHHRRSVDEPESLVYAKQIPYNKMS